VKISKQDDDIETGSLQIDKLVYGNEMTEMYLSTGFIPGIDRFVRLCKKCSEVLARDDFNSIPGCQLVRIHQK
jgi:hypothetical protein